MHSWEFQQKHLQKDIQMWLGPGSNRRPNDFQSFARTNWATKPNKVLISALNKYDTKTFATRTGLEPATSAVTGRRANQLRYRALSDW